MSSHRHPILPLRAAAVAVTGALLLVGALAGQSRVGQQAPGFALTDQDGRSHRLADLRGRVVVLEWINPNCPFSRRHAEQGTMASLARQNPGVVWLAVNSTAPGHRDYLPPAEHQELNARLGIRYPVLFDSDGKVGRAYGATTTPHMVVIDEQGRVIYEGAIDDDAYGRSSQPTNYVRQALAAHAAGRAPQPASTPSYGCSVKYGA
jgi:peroxiredoxin